MRKVYEIPACEGRSAEVRQGQMITVTDIEGGQVVDFFAETMDDPDEYLSAPVTIDCNESLYLKVGDRIYTNHYRPMLEIVKDDVEEHDLIHPSCRPEMYDFFYHNGEGHPNCHDNINNALHRNHTTIVPINLFMYSKIDENGDFKVVAPISKAGDQIVFRALMDLRIGAAACSVSESECNSGRCTAVQITVE